MARTASFVLVSLSLLALTFAGCGNDRRRPGFDAGPGGGDTGPPSSCVAGGQPRICRGSLEVTCNPDGSEGGQRDCSSLGQTCQTSIGCAVCRPGIGMCMGNTAQRCRTDGSGYDVTATCDPAMGQACDAATGTCQSPCDAARASNSYIGCEYWPVATINTQLDRATFGFAVVVSNPQDANATVTVTRGGSPVTTVTVAPHAVETIPLPWVDQLQGTAGMEASALVTGGAYRLVSTLPVTVYQFNALEFSVGSTFSFTNDASLLLPTHVLTPNYVVVSRPSMLLQQTVPGFPPFIPDMMQTLSSPGFFAVYAAGEGTTTVMAQFTSSVVASTDGRVRAFGRGETGTFMLQQGDVLQIIAGTPATCAPGGSDPDGGGGTWTYCTVTDQHDLTGTEIRASGPVGVISGHNCDFVPYNRWACDHLEQHLFPEEVWGREAIVSTTQPLRGEPNIVRITSGRDNNMLTFDPPSAHAATTLNRGQILEFEARDSFRVSGTEALQVVQFMVGQDYAGFMSGGAGGQGDPAMCMAIPSEQYRTQYAFLAPTTYTSSYVNVTAPMGASIMLDGIAVAGFVPVGGSGFGVARVPIAGGAHDISGDVAFGIVVYGYASYTSYMYPGGLDLEQINIPF